MRTKKYFIVQCMIVWIAFPGIDNAQTIQNGSWSTASGDVKFYVSQHSQIDTLSVRITHTSGSCSGSVTKYYYGISITDGSFSKDLGSTWDGSTGSITGDFSHDGASCSGSYSYTEPPCNPVNVEWTATATDPDTTEEGPVEIVDVNFLNALIAEGVDTNGDNVISHSEAKAVGFLNVSEQQITDMKGIEAFVNLDTLSCIFNQITSLDVSGNPELEVLWCRDNQISTLDISNNPVLGLISCRNNKLAELDVSNIPTLRTLYCSNNQLTSLDVSNNQFLLNLFCEDNLLPSLVVSNNPTLEVLSCHSNKLLNLDVSNNPDLWLLWCSNNQLTSLDVSNNSDLVDLWCGVNQLTSLDVSHNPSLVELWCEDNLISSLDLSNNIDIDDLWCGTNQLTNLDVSNNLLLVALWCEKNLISSLDVSENTLITDLSCYRNQLSNLDVSNNSDLESLFCFSNQLTSLDVSNNQSLVELWCGDNLLTSLDISANSAIGSVDSESADLEISYMPSLYEVCVWTMPFPPSGVAVDTTSSPNVFFTTDCSGGTSIEEVSHSRLLVYPNPVVDILTIKTDNHSEFSITITSVNGQIIDSRNSVGSLHRIDLSSLQLGVYFITIRSERFIATEKIIKL